MQHKAALKNGDWDKVAHEIKALKHACGDRVLKVIVETCYLTEAEKVQLCKIVTDAKADYIKTSTGFGSAGATVADETIKGTKVNKVTAMVDALNEVLAGTSDVAIIDITMAQSVVGKGAYADLQILDGASYGDEIFAVGLRKGSDLKVELDNVIDTVKSIIEERLK